MSDHHIYPKIDEEMLPIINVKNYLQVILFHTSGNLFSYIIGDLLSFRLVLWICLTIAIIHLMLCIMIPESPSFLIKQGKEDVGTTDN